ncbi:MAG: PspA/IM30 family protein [Flavobacteriales bacterium]|nr:PspA/IM30 family protein [Flavobacteriales bacterium]
MNIFKRLFRIGEAQVHSTIDKLEDPIAMTEQGIREMKEQLDKAIQALAEIKALAIRKKNEVESSKNQADEYQNKAMIILKRSSEGEIPQEDADRLASEAIKKKNQALNNSKIATQAQEKYETDVAKMQKNINELKADISKWEGELKTLKARVKVSEATKNINKSMAAIDSNSTVSLLERMKEKVEEQESLAEAYGEIVDSSKSIDEEIDSYTNQEDMQVASELEKLKNQLNRQ